jgi:hypothetical protein
VESSSEISASAVVLVNWLPSATNRSWLVFVSTLPIVTFAPEIARKSGPDRLTKFRLPRRSKAETRSFMATWWVPPAIPTSTAGVSVTVRTPPSVTNRNRPLSVSGLSFASSSPPFSPTNDEDAPPAPPTPLISRMSPESPAVPATSGVLDRWISGVFRKVVSVAPLSTPITSEVVLMLLSVAYSSPPFRLTLAAPGPTFGRPGFVEVPP